ncbi:alpha/beta hydrolase [Mycolicibacter algericus]|uniref:Esterase n=2 Tax=Mycolicibacter algericus TaxID=1288388 RepID=A0A7I9YFM2_MYCAL|nr:alpha/beta hydrolase [Mycolicibacter algericus]OQZ98912.1 alpha/beta hydrolase [Mycolicibacter algericus DSM 45454]GFG87478.1 esterase [Mycolicibacter algericus]
MVSSGFHPDLRRAARFLPRGGIGPRTLPAIRALAGLQGRRTPSGIEVLPLPSGGSVRVYRPPHRPAAPAPALLWIHGGGYVIGTAAQDDRLCRRFSDELGITVASVDYRLAPQHPYPAALEDCWAGLLLLAGLAGVDPTRVAIGGASAGGGLAAALAQLAADRGDAQPVLQLLVYPMLDDRSAHLPADRGYRLWNPRSNLFGWTSYLGDADPQLAVPARRADLRGLAPAWIGVGTLDLFHDENLAYAERLRAAGVPCEVETVPGAFHGFDLLLTKAPVSRSFFASQCASLRNAFKET